VTVRIILAGVGGQGILTLARMIGNLARILNLDVKVSEVHGMAQRGGSVVVHISIGSEVNSPLIPYGKADWLVGLELIEACRYLDYCNKQTKIVIDKRIINPPLSGIVLTSNELINLIRANYSNVYLISAYERACELGNPLLTNSIVFGFLCRLKLLDADYSDYVQALSETIPKKVLRDNITAFNEGLKMNEAQGNSF